MLEFQTYIEKFHALLAMPELRKLMMPPIGIEKPYEVFIPDGFKVEDLSITDNTISANFTLVLREVKPVIETFNLIILLDTDGVPILTTEGKYIYVIADLVELANNNIYLLLTSETGDINYIFTVNELNPLHADYDAEALEKYVFLTTEL
jgi:hypothetical protein